MKNKLKRWVDVIFLLIGMTFFIIGAFEFYIPAGYIITGGCFVALAFFIGKQQAGGE